MFSEVYEAIKMVKIPKDVVKEVYIRKTTNEKINILFDSETFRDALIQNLIIYKVNLEFTLTTNNKNFNLFIY